MLDVPQCRWGIARVRSPTVHWPSFIEGRGRTLTLTLTWTPKKRVGGDYSLIRNLQTKHGPSKETMKNHLDAKSDILY